MDISLHPEQVLKFKQWYDAVWLGDEEHGQTIPQTFSDERYAEYVDGYTLALGAWLESARQTANLNLLEAGLLDAHEPEREGPKFLDWVADRPVNVYGESENVDFIICLRRRAAKAAAAIARARVKVKETNKMKFVAVHEWTATSFFQGKVKVYADVKVPKESVENYINKLPGMSGGNWNKESLTYKYIKINSKIANSQFILSA